MLFIIVIIATVIAICSIGSAFDKMDAKSERDIYDWARPSAKYYK